MQAAERQARSIEDDFDEQGYTYTGGIDVYHVTVTARRPSGAIVATAAVKKGPQTAGLPLFEVTGLRMPRRRVIILDIDGLRWDTFRTHLRKVRDEGAWLDRTYYFEKRYDATQSTVIGSGKNLRSGLAFLCFDAQMAGPKYGWRARRSPRIRSPRTARCSPACGRTCTGSPGTHTSNATGRFNGSSATGKGCRTARRCKGIGRQTVG